MSYDDFELIDRTLRGQQWAFGELVRRYQTRLFTALAHVLGSPEDAEDVLQEAFWKAYCHLDRFQRSSGFYTWLYRIAFNVAVSSRRRRRSEFSVEELRAAGAADPASNEPAVSEPIERSEMVARVRAALNRLSEEHRAVLVLREIEGCCYETIAQILGVPVGTVRSRLHRARAQLRDVLLHELPGSPNP